MRRATQTIRTIDLDYHQLWVFEGARDARVRVLYGAAWLTEEGDPGDAILHAGSEVALRGGRTLIEALGPSRVQIAGRVSRSTTRAAAWLRQAWRSVRQRIARLQLGATASEPCA